MSITPFLETNVFEPEMSRLLGRVFDAVCRELHDTGQPAIVREVIAQRIIAAAKLGERDPARLRAAVLDACQERASDRSPRPR